MLMTHRRTPKFRRTIKSCNFLLRYKTVTSKLHRMKDVMNEQLWHEAIFFLSFLDGLRREVFKVRLHVVWISTDKYGNTNMWQRATNKRFIKSLSYHILFFTWNDIKLEERQLIWKSWQICMNYTIMIVTRIDFFCHQKKLKTWLK